MSDYLCVLCDTSLDGHKVYTEIDFWLAGRSSKNAGGRMRTHTYFLCTDCHELLENFLKVGRTLQE